MKNNFKKGLVMFAMVMFAFTAMNTAVVLTAQAMDDNATLGFDIIDDQGIGLANNEISDPRVMAINIVKFFMTFLGIIAVVIILLGGFKWMTAAGNEDKVAEAKKLLVAGIIGLAIIVSAYVIVNFVITTTTDLIDDGTIEYTG